MNQIFEDLLNRIRQNVDQFMVDPDVRLLQDNEEAWAGLEELGFAEDATRVFQEEARQQYEQLDLGLGSQVKALGEFAAQALPV